MDTGHTLFDFHLSKKISCRAVFILSFLFTYGFVFAQSTWHHTYGGMSDDGGLGLIETPDSGYIVVGYTGSFGSGASDAYLIKTDSLGIFQWYKTYGGANVDIAQKIIKAQTNGYILAGYSNSNTLDYDMWILRLNENADTIWTKKIGGPDWDRANAVVSCEDGTYILAGETYSGNNQFADGMLIKFDDTGLELWTATFSLPGNQSFNDIVRISPTRYAVTGSTENSITLESDGFLLFLDENGNFLDTIYFDTGNNEYLQAMAIAPDFDIMLGGYYTYDSTAFPKSIQIKTDTLGQVQFTLPGPIPDDYGMQILSYGHFTGDIFFFAGRSFYKSSEDHQAVFFRSFFDGFPEWFKNYGIIGKDDGYNAVIKSYDNGFVCTGFTQSFGPGTQALLLSKINAQGDINSGTTVDINEHALISESANINVYPNPSDRIFYILSPVEFTYRVLDVNARPIRVLNSSPNLNAELDMSGHKAGFYFIEMTFADGSIRYHKIGLN